MLLLLFLGGRGAVPIFVSTTLSCDLTEDVVLFSEKPCIELSTVGLIPICSISCIASGSYWGALFYSFCVLYVRYLFWSPELQIDGDTPIEGVCSAAQYYVFCKCWSRIGLIWSSDGVTEWL